MTKTKYIDCFFVLTMAFASLYSGKYGKMAKRPGFMKKCKHFGIAQGKMLF